MRHTSWRLGIVAAAASLGVAGGAAAATAGPSGPAVRQTSFTMVRSAGAVAAGCLKGAIASVSIQSSGPAEVMTISASHLPPDTGFDLFVIQVPDAPFGISWYQGDLDSSSTGTAHGTFIGRFSAETFVVAPGVAPAPQVHTGPPFPDARQNPATAPVHTYHLGLWFNSPRAAARAGCPAAVTPFNGTHTAGVQALSTRNFPDLAGPLRRIQP